MRVIHRVSLAVVAFATLVGCGEESAGETFGGGSGGAGSGTGAGNPGSGGRREGSAGASATGGTPSAGTADSSDTTAGVAGSSSGGTPGSDGSGGASEGSGGAGEGSGGAGEGSGGAGEGSGGVTSGHRFVFVETEAITHERDYFPFQYGDPSYVPAEVPTNWLSPVDYRQGTLHMTLDVLEVPEGASAEFYYTVTFTQAGADYDEGWLRPAIHVVPGQAHYEDSWPVGDTQFVWNDGTEHTSTAAERWDFSRPFDKVAGDLVAWPNASFPIRVRVKIELSLP